MRIALAGKGGAGKTTISAALCRLLAQRGERVLAVDADSNPNLALALGVDPASAHGVPSLPSGLVSRRLDGPFLTAPFDDVVARHALRAPDGVAVLAMGAPAHADEGCLCSAHAVVSALLGEVGAHPAVHAIVDMEASPEHLSRGTARHVDVLLLVAEPYYRALEAVRRLADLAAQLPIPRIAVVANKLRSAEDGEAVADFCRRHDLELLAAIPWSDEVGAADRRARSLVDDASASAPVVRAVIDLADALTRPALQRR